VNRRDALANAFSEKIDNHGHAVALYFVFLQHLPGASNPQGLFPQWKRVLRETFGQSKSLPVFWGRKAITGE
jgi:hypothetical protein